MSTEAVIICTRNRPKDLLRLLKSLSDQSGMAGRRVLIVDASDNEPAGENEILADHIDNLDIEYHRYQAPPSLARQRNAGVAHLPETIRIVHFFDDDVTLGPDCLSKISAAFADPLVLGAGGRVETPGQALKRPSRLARLFLLDGTSPGRVRISGAAISGQVRGSGPPFATQWLGGCSSYRRSVLLDERFDARLDGYSLDEDLDLSFRVARRGTLLVVPDALIVHHESKQGRATPADYARDHLIHRYWFIEKNLDHPLKKTAFWWSTIGRLLAARSGTDARRKETFEGLVEGVRIVWNRDHPLLSPYP